MIHRGFHSPTLRVSQSVSQVTMPGQLKAPSSKRKLRLRGKETFYSLAIELVVP